MKGKELKPIDVHNVVIDNQNEEHKNIRNIADYWLKHIWENRSKYKKK